MLKTFLLQLTWRAHGSLSKQATVRLKPATLKPPLSSSAPQTCVMWTTMWKLWTAREAAQQCTASGNKTTSQNWWSSARWGSGSTGISVNALPIKEPAGSSSIQVRPTYCMWNGGRGWCNCGDPDYCVCKAETMRIIKTGPGNTGDGMEWMWMDGFRVYVCPFMWSF